MKTVVMSLVCLSILVGTAVVGWPQQVGDADVGAEVLALEHAWNQAEALKDLKTLDQLFDDGVAYVDFDGALSTKTEYLLRVKSRPFAQGTTESMTARVYASVVIVTGIYTSTQVKRGQTVLRRGRFVDAWVRRGQSWVCVAAEVTPLQN